MAEQLVVLAAAFDIVAKAKSPPTPMTSSPLMERYKGGNDPNFAVKLADMIGLYLNPLKMRCL